MAAAALTALHVLAVNDETIQTMVALGVLPIVTEALRRSLSCALTSGTGGSVETEETEKEEEYCCRGAEVCGGVDGTAV